MTWADMLLALLRGGHLLALVSLFGTLISLAMVAPADPREAGAAADPVRHRLIGLARWSTLAALVLGALWAAAQAAEIAGASTVRDALAALGPVSLQTQFGHVTLVRCGLLVAAGAALATPRPRVAAALPLAGIALALQAFAGHAGAVGGGPGALLLVSEALHLLAAGAWLGGLVPLLLMIEAYPPRAAVAACAAFSPVGGVSVALIAGTALVQSTRWIAGLGGLFGTTYGHIALLKLILFAMLLGLAALNRFALTARLLGPGAAGARPLLRTSIVAEAMLGTAVIFVAALLASATPATHEAPDWPFSRRPSLELLTDPEAWELFQYPLALIACAGILAGAGWVWRRVRWPARAVAAILAGLAAMGLVPLLTVAAYPTSFVTSPTEFAVESIARGADLYAANCASCHGVNGRGDGPAATTLPVRPADLTAPHLLAHSDGDLFWFISHGIDAPSGRPAMPAFAGAISSDGVWALIDYLKAHHAGMTARNAGMLEPPVALPQFDAICADGMPIQRDDQRGRVLRIVTMPADAPATPVVEGIDIRTILLARHPTLRPPPSACAIVQPEAWTAFAILLGVPPGELAGTEMLADANSWLRAFLKPNAGGGPVDARRRVTIVRDIAAHPVMDASLAAHAHGH